MGTTTDALGAVLNLREAGIELDGKRVTILGTGGAARALAFVLARGSCAGAGGGRESFRLPELTLLGRDPDKAERLSQDIAAGSAAGTAVRSGLLAEFAALGGGADLIINCTSAGMTPDVRGCPIDPALLDPRQVVYDIVLPTSGNGAPKGSRSEGVPDGGGYRHAGAPRRRVLPHLVRPRSGHGCDVQRPCVIPLRMTAAERDPWGASVACDFRANGVSCDRKTGVRWSTNKALQAKIGSRRRNGFHRGHNR